MQPPPVWWTVNPCAQFSKSSLVQFGELLTPVPNSPNPVSSSLVNCYPLCPILQVQPPPVWWTVNTCAQFSKSSLVQFGELLTPVPNSPNPASSSLVNCYPLCPILQVQPPPVWGTVTPCAQFSKCSLHHFGELLTPVPNSPSAASTTLVNC